MILLDYIGKTKTKKILINKRMKNEKLIKVSA